MDPTLKARVVKALQQAARDARVTVDAEEAGDLAQILQLEEVPAAPPAAVEVPPAADIPAPEGEPVTTEGEP